MNTKLRKKLLRKVLPIFVAAAMVFVLIPSAAFADGTGITTDKEDAKTIPFNTPVAFGVESDPDGYSSSNQWGTFNVAVPSIVTIKVDTPAPKGEAANQNWNHNSLYVNLYASDDEDTNRVTSYSTYEGDDTIHSTSDTLKKSATSKYKVLPGTYYINATGSWNGYGKVTVSTQAVSFSAADKEYNNEKVGAQSIAFNTAYTGLIGYAGAKDGKGKLNNSDGGYDYYDYYKFTIPTDGTAVKLDFSRPNDGDSRGFNASIGAGDDVTSYWTENGKYMYNSTGDTIYLKDKVSGSTTAKLGKGTYYICVSGSWANAGEYTLKLTNYNLTVPAKKSIAKGTSVALGAKSTPVTNLYYKSSDTSVVAVDVNGKITGKKAGIATITVYAGSQGSAFYKTCAVTVTAMPSKIKLNAAKKTLKKSKSFTVKVKTWTPAKATIAKANQKLTFKSSNKKVATVSASGKIKAKKKGKATITVKTVNGKTAKCKITVK
jgi:hypothetical protein